MDVIVGKLRHTEAMKRHRAVLMITGLLVAGAGVVFLILGLDQASKAASVTGAVVAIAGLGFSIWTYMKNAPSAKNTNEWGHIHVTDSTGVQFGRDHITQDNKFGAVATKKDDDSTQSGNKGQRLDEA
jgi:hypothetical protein